MDAPRSSTTQERVNLSVELLSYSSGATLPAVDRSGD